MVQWVWIEAEPAYPTRRAHPVKKTSVPKCCPPLKLGLKLPAEALHVAGAGPLVPVQETQCLRRAQKTLP